MRNLLSPHLTAQIREILHQYAAQLLEKGDVHNAWKTLLCDSLNRA